MQRPWWILVGGRRRLGRILAEGLASEANLVLTSSGGWDQDRAWVEELSTEAPAETLAWDAGDARLVSTMMADVARLQGHGIRFRSAVLVAGSFPEAPLGTWTAEGLAATWNLNLSFPLLAAQALAGAMEPGGVLQVLLDSAIHRPFLRRLPYTAAKAGLAALVPGLARALAPKVRVVGHALGTVLPEEGGDPQTLADQSPLGRLGTPEDLLRALRYAAESPYLTGEVLTLDGGRRWA